MRKNYQNININFEYIISLENIRLAYFDLSKKFDKDFKTGRYRGVDGILLKNIDFISEETFIEIRKEMLSFNDITPAYLTLIPKKNGKKRKIYIYSIKERIKAEAIYRVLEPYFDNYFSEFLFSYRSSHPSYYAAKSTVRRYKRKYGENYVLVVDITDYADSIDHDLLLKKIESLGFDKKILKLLELFIKTKTHENGKLIIRPNGVLTGTPLYTILANFYMDEFDKWAGKSVAFYRRVGDDMIAMDKDQNKILSVKLELSKTINRLKLKINENKSSLIKDTEPFKFLGYQFKNGLVGFDQNSMNKAISSWKKNINSKGGRSVKARIRNARKLNRKTNGADYEFGILLKQKVLVNDTKQIRNFSNKFAGSLASYIYGYNNKHKRTLASKLLRKLHIRSLFKQYQIFHTR